MSRFYNIVMHPKYGECPLWEGDDANCSECSYCQFIGTYGDEYYVDCDVNQKE